MRIYPPDIVIEEDEGFTPEKDLFNRKEFGISLQNIFERVEDPLVVVLDEPWGMGKTTFIKMFAGHMRQNDFKVIYFDAFANDYAEGAFASLAGEIVAIAKQHCGATEPVKKFIESAASVGKRLAPTLANVAIKALTLNTFSSEDAKEIISSASDTLGSFAQEQLKKAIEDHDASKGQREELREALSSIVQSLGAKRDDQTSDDVSKPLIIIIDELDRCKPTYALDIIENIKHFFSIPGVHFLLVAHLEQLENSVRFSYGQSIDAETYLQKFYNITAKFPQETRYRTHSFRYIQHTFSILAKDHTRFRDIDKAIAILECISHAQGLSYRTISKIASTFFLLLSQHDSTCFYDLPTLIILCAIKVTNAKLITELSNNTAHFEQVSNHLKIDQWTDREGGQIQDDYIKILEHLLTPKGKTLPEELTKFHPNRRLVIPNDREFAISHTCKSLLTIKAP